LHDTTPPAGQSKHLPDDELRRLLQHLVRAGGVLEPNPALHEHGGVRVSMSEVFALGELSEAGTLTQQDLAWRLGLEKSTVSRLAAGMEVRGWLSRQREDTNRNYYQLRLTAEGQDVARRVGQDLREHHGHLLDLLTPKERRALTTGLTGLIRAMESHGHPHGPTPAANPR
jgi:DNA-binding MarR family transcriptional regulator